MWPTLPPRAYGQVELLGSLVTGTRLSDRVRPLALLPLLILGLLLSFGCGGGAVGAPPGPLVSPTGVVYPPGQPPLETRFSQTATLYLRAGEPDRALEQAMAGVQSDPANPIHHFLAGVAAARLDRFIEADDHFLEAERLYPAYALQIEPEREAAWAEAFNRGAEAYSEGRPDEARRAWEGAAVIHNLRPEAHRNLAMLLTLEGDTESAVDLYRRALEGLGKAPVTRLLSEEEEARRQVEGEDVADALVDLLLAMGRYDEAEPLLRDRLAEASDLDRPALRQNLATALEGLDRDDEAAEIYESLLGQDGLEETQLFNLGIRLFRTGNPARAADAFGTLVEQRPYSRDFWFNYLNALFASEDWVALVEAGPDAVAVDPLNETLRLIVARAHLELGDQEAALAELEAVDALPVFLEGVTLRGTGSAVRVEGRIVGNAAQPGDTVILHFLFHGPMGPEGEQEVRLEAPGPEESRGFELEVEGRPDAFRYRLLRWDPVR